MAGRRRRSKVDWWPAERQAWKPPEDLTVTEWAQRSVCIPHKGNAEGGPYRISRTPYARGIMDAWGNPDVTKIVFLKSTQIGGSQMQLNCLGYAIDQDPGPTLYVLPKEEIARDFADERIARQIEGSPDLYRHFVDKKGLHFKCDLMDVSLGAATQPDSLASKAIRYLILDEVDKYPAFSGKEADPVSLAEERTRTFWNYKIFVTSTPTNRYGLVWRAWQACDVQLRYWVPCPCCDAYFLFSKEHLHWPEDERDERLIRQHDLAQYFCPECGEEVLDTDKPEMLDRGVWAREEDEVLEDGSIVDPPEISGEVGFFVNCFYSPWITWSDIAAKWVKSQGDVALLMNFINSWLGEIWEEKDHDITKKTVAARRGGYKQQECPPGVKVITAGVDVQKNKFYCVIRGWGYGEESWLLKAGQPIYWESLARELFEIRYGDLPIRMAFVDSGYRTDEVYEFTRAWQDVSRPIKGLDRTRSGVPITVSKIDRHPYTGSAYRGSVQLCNLDTDFFKDKLMRLIANKDEALWHLPENVTDEYLRQVVSEHRIYVRNRNKRGGHYEWVTKPGHRANHFLDCEVYALAAAYQIGVHAMVRPTDDVPKSSSRGRRRSEGDEQAERYNRKRSRGGYLDRVRGGRRR